MFDLLVVMTCLSAAPADTWPTFRGTGDSISQASRLPIAWSETSGIAWTADLPGYGQSSPVVWHDRVFVTMADGSNKERAIVVSFDLNTGRKIWQKEFQSSQPGEVSDYTSRAAPTPATDNARVFAFFEMGNLVALKHDGTMVWQKSLTDEFGKFQGDHGVCSSIALTTDAVIVLVDHDGPSYLLASDKNTGKALWKKTRPKKESWSSPIVVGEQIIISSIGSCEAIDAKSGEQLWLVDGIKGNNVSSPTVSELTVVVGSSEVGSNLAIRRGGQTDVTHSHVLWRSSEATATFSSPLVYQGHVYLVNQSGVAFCLEETTGKTVWKQRIGGPCWASPLGACDRVYFLATKGETTVVATGPDLKVIAKNSLPTQDRVYGVAVVEGKILVRTGSRLTCIKN